jgi:hypothetical protein
MQESYPSRICFAVESNPLMLQMLSLSFRGLLLDDLSACSVLSIFSRILLIFSSMLDCFRCFPSSIEEAFLSSSLSRKQLLPSSSSPFARYT